MCILTCVIRNYEGDARFHAREACVSFTEFLSRRLRFDSSFTVYIILLLPASAPNAKNIKAGQFNREMSIDN